MSFPAASWWEAACFFEGLTKWREMSEKEAGIEVQGKVEESSGGMYRSWM